jgi:hypothetical protein
MREDVLERLRAKGKAPEKSGAFPFALLGHDSIT